MAFKLCSPALDNDLINQRRINNILEEEADNIIEAQDRILNREKDSPKIEYIEASRSFTVSNMNLKLEHHIQERFVDMKRTRYGRQKPVKVHNSIIFGHLEQYRIPIKI